MEDDRLPTDVWVMAHVRQANASGMAAYVVRKGARLGGTVLVKLNQPDLGCRVLSQVRDLDGTMAWMTAHGAEPVPEAEADAYIARAVDRDPDLWVVEFEDRQGRNPFEGKEL